MAASTLLIAGIGRFETQRGVGSQQHVLALGYRDAHISGHAGQQNLLGIIHIDHHIVGHYILYGGRIKPYQLDLALKVAPREGIHREAHRLPDADAADVRLGKVRIDLHLG